MALTPAPRWVMIFDTPATSVVSEAEVDDGSAAARCVHWQEFM